MTDEEALEIDPRSALTGETGPCRVIGWAAAIALHRADMYERQAMTLLDAAHECPDPAAEFELTAEAGTSAALAAFWAARAVML